MKLKQQIYLRQSGFVFASNKCLTLHKIDRNLQNVVGNTHILVIRRFQRWTETPKIVEFRCFRRSNFHPFLAFYLLFIVINIDCCFYQCLLIGENCNRWNYYINYYIILIDAHDIFCINKSSAICRVEDSIACNRYDILPNLEKDSTSERGRVARVGSIRQC